MVETFEAYYEKHRQKVNLNDHKLFDSQTLFTEMAVLNPHAVSKAQNAFQFIHDNGIRGVLIGGMAVSHYTTDRKLTPDVDFMTDEIAKVKQILNGQNIPYKPLASDGNYDGIQVPHLDADFLDASVGNVAMNRHIMKTAKPANIGGVTFNVIDPSVLTIMKFAIGRNKDMDDAFKLLQTNKDKPGLKQHLGSLKGSLGDNIDAKSIWDYATML